MKGSNLLRNLSFHTRHLRLPPFNRNLPSLSLPTYFSSRSDPPNLPQTQKKQEPLDVEEISNEELKRRVAKLQEGDAEAIPSVFEAILQRYLTGKPIDADKELMREILGKGTGSEDEDEDDDEYHSDLEGMSDTDYEDEEDFDLDFKARNSEVDGKKIKR